MNPSPREIRVLFVPPAWRESPTSLRTPLTPSETPRHFPRSPSASMLLLYPWLKQHTEKRINTPLSQGRNRSRWISFFRNLTLPLFLGTRFLHLHISGIAFHPFATACVCFSTRMAKEIKCGFSFGIIIGKIVLCFRVCCAERYEWRQHVFDK